MSELQFTEKFIAFFDVLGWTSLVRASDEGCGLSLPELSEIATMLGTSADREHFEKYGPTTCPKAPYIRKNMDFRITQVSDSALISAEVSPAGLINLVSHCWTACFKLLSKGIMCRGVPSVRSGTGSRQRQSYRPSLPPQSAPRVEEDQAGLAGVELRDRSGRPDPLALDFDDRSGGCVATAGPIAFTGSSGGETTDFDGKAKNPHHGPNQGRTRGGSLDAVRALRPARAGGHRRSVVQEMSPGRQQKN